LRVAVGALCDSASCTVAEPLTHRDEDHVKLIGCSGPCAPRATSGDTASCEPSEGRLNSNLND